MASITFASAQTEINESECSTCHDVTFDVFSVNRSDTCDAKCHGNAGYAGSQHKYVSTVLTDYGQFKSNESVNVAAPTVHDVHYDSNKGAAICNSCHLKTSECSNCHSSDDILHFAHGPKTEDPAYTCGDGLCHNLNSGVLWTINQPKPACENCHTRHDITTVHQSTLSLDCQTCHSNYLPDTHAEIADINYSGDSCAVCHQSADPAVTSAIANNDTNCASCHTLHGDITEIHTLNTTTSTLNCPECHQATYVPDLHNNFSVENNLPTSCSLCHNNVNISTSIASSECDSCHGNANQQLPVQHLNANHTSVSDCIICHDDAELPIIHLDNCSVCHTNPTKVDIDSATNDCRSCHVVQDVGYHTSMNNTHSSTTDCTTCHETDLPTVHLDNCSTCHTNSAINSTLATADCNSCHVDQNVGYHTNMSDKHTSTSGCTNCHTDSYLPDLHNDFALANNLTSCEVCHNNAQIAISNATSDCATCHDSQLPTQHANEAAKHTTSTCATCHGTLNGSYLPDTHNATVDNDGCDLCHNNVAIDISTSTSECDSCHGLQVSGAHSEALVKHTFESPTECEACHDLYVPITHSAEHNNTNCFMCHRNNLAITELPTDKNCTSCHGGQLDTQHVNEETKHNVTSSLEAGGCLGSLCHDTGYVPTLHENLGKGYNCSTCHNNSAVTITTAECSNCHTPHGDVNVLHDSMNSSSCLDCHEGISGSTDIRVVHKDNCATCHSDTATVVYNGTTDCTDCHSNTGDATKVSYHVNESASHSFTVCGGCHRQGTTSNAPGDVPIVHNATEENGGCVELCHANPEIDMSIVDITQNFYCYHCHGGFQNSPLLSPHSRIEVGHNFVSSSASVECMACHDESSDVSVLHSANVGQYWTCLECHDSNLNGVTYSNKIGFVPSDKNCSSCHGPQLPAQHANENVKHTSGTLTAECTSCHTTNYLPTLHNNSGYNCTTCHNADPLRIDWASGNINSSCDSCHTLHGDLGVLHTSTSTCIVCHDSDLRTAHNDTCSLCHGSTAQVILPTNTNCDSCHDSQLPMQHANESVKHTSDTLTAECTSCHTTNYLPTLHEDLGKGYDCNTCHNNADPSRIDWNTATSSCDSCHTLHGDLTVVHTTTESQGCAKCHDTNVVATHNDVCSTCHGSTLIPTLPSTVECTECHGANAPVPVHNFQSGNSYHPTEVVGTNDMISSQAFVNGWSMSSITGCDACHADSAPGTITLIKPYAHVYPDRNRDQSSGDICFMCHNPDTYIGRSNQNSNFVGDGGKNLHPGNFGDHGEIGCYACHDVHSSTNRRLITDRVDPETGKQWMTSWVQHSGSYKEDDCVSSHPECGDHNPGSRSVTPAVITGTVTYNGVVVPNAKVSSDKYGGIIAYTDASGHYDMPNLYYGTYSLTATANGESQTASISVNQGDSKVLNIALTGTVTQPTTGSIGVFSIPVGAIVDLDGAYQGITPLTLDSVSAGSHTVKLAMSGYDDTLVNIDVIAGQQTVVSETLTAVSTPPQTTTGSISISSSPSGATVYLDGVDQGITQLTLDGVSSGSHIVKLTMSGYGDTVVNIDVIADQQTVVLETLTEVSTPPQPTTGSIVISSSPVGATVYLDGANQGITPRTLNDVSEGSHVVKLTKPDYIDTLVNIDVIAGQQTDVSETLEAVPQTVSGEGYKLSKNPDFSTEDREYSTSDTIYVKVWSDQVDYTDMDRMYFEIKDVTRMTLENNGDGTFTGSYDLSRARRTGERDFKIRLEDDRDEEYRVSTKIDISGSSSYWRR